MRTTRTALTALAAAGLAAACSGPPAPLPDAPTTTAPTTTAPAPVDSVDGMLAWVAARPGDVAVLVDDGRGGVLAHRPDAPQPLASAGKVVHLVAYARAVADGRLDPEAQVPVAEWERWWVPGTDGGAHEAALEASGVGADGAVRWDDLVAAMIDYSDNAVPDLLRATLGDAALRDAAAAAGWTDADLPSFGGEILLAPGPATGDRRAAAVATLQAYADDPAQRAAVAGAIAGTSTSPPPSPAPDPAAAEAAALAWWDGGPSGTATQLAAVHRAAATDALGPEVSATVRRHLERGLTGRLPAGVVGAGQKGGSLPGVLTHAVTLRRADGTVASAVVLVARMPLAPYAEAVGSGALLQLAQQALLDDGVRDRLAAAVGAG